MKKRLLACIMAALMLFSMSPPAFAATVVSGSPVRAFSWATVTNKLLLRLELNDMLTSSQLAFIKSYVPTNVFIFDMENGDLGYCYVVGTPYITKGEVYAKCAIMFFRYHDKPYGRKAAYYNLYYYNLGMYGDVEIRPTGIDSSRLLASTCDIKDETGKTIIEKSFDYAAEGDMEPGYDLDNDWLSNTKEEGIYIVAPQSGKVFSSKDPSVNITVQYRFEGAPTFVGYHHAYASIDGKKYEKIGDAVSGSPFSGVILKQDKKIVTRDGKMYEEGTIVYELKVRKNMKLDIYMDMEVIPAVGSIIKDTFSSNHINLTWYDDFIDEDGDGDDDRDPNPDYHPSQDDDLNAPDLSGMESITDVLNSLKGTLSGFISFLTNFFKFIPEPIFWIMGLGLSICFLLRIFGR